MQPMNNNPRLLPKKSLLVENFPKMQQKNKWINLQEPDKNQTMLRYAFPKQNQTLSDKPLFQDSY